MNDFINSTIEAMHETLELIESHTDELYIKQRVGFGGDISFNIDLASEAILIKYLQKYGKIFSEESGYIGEDDSTIIHIDPLDGSDNFASNIPYYGISVAREIDGAICDGMVLNLISKELFIRSGSFNEVFKLEKTLKKQELYRLQNPPVAIFEKAYEHPYLSNELRKAGYKFRSPGAIALSLCYAPYVKYVLFLGTMRTYDIVAALYINEHLYLEKNDKYILISSDLEVFNSVNEIVKRSPLESI